LGFFGLLRLFYREVGRAPVARPRPLAGRKIDLAPAAVE
jgi:hypothetical protein